MRKWKKGMSAFLAAVMMLSAAAVLPGEAQAETKENVALGKTVTAAEGMPTDGLEKVTDGRKARGWSNSYMYHLAPETEDTETRPYITIDLGQSYEIDQIIYFGVWPPDEGYYNQSHNMVIRVSEDPDFEDDTTMTVYNTDVNDFFGFGNGTDTEGLYQEPWNKEEGISIEFSPVEARYVRYYQHGTSESDHADKNRWPNALSAGEIEVYTAGGELPVKLVPEGNKAYQAEVTGSEFNSKGNDTNGWFGGWGRNDLSDLTSGAITDYWKAPTVNVDGDKGELVYVLMEMRKAQEINTIQIWSKPKNTYLAQIVQVSEDGENWVNVYNSDAENRAGQDPTDSEKAVCGGRLQNGRITGVNAGNDETYAEKSNEPRTITFDTETVKYIRWWCSGHTTGYIETKPQMIQLQAYCKRSVIFDYQDSDRSETVSVTEGTNVPKPETPLYSEPGKIFDKWTVNTEGGQEWDFTNPVTEDMVLVANWKEVPVHTVTFDTEGGNSIDPIQVTDTLTVAKPENPEKEGWVFAGWKLNGQPYHFGSSVTGDITLTATWVEPAEPDAVTIDAGLLDIVLDSHGNITKLISTLDGTDYSNLEPDNRVRSLISLVAEYNIETPTSVRLDETTSELFFEFASINTEATVAMKNQGNYVSLTLTDVKKPENTSLQAVLWGPIKTTIETGGQSVGVVYDDNYAIGMHRLNTKTFGGWPIEFKEDFYPSNLPRVNGELDPRMTSSVYMNSATFCDWGSALQSYTWDYTEDTMRTICGWGERFPDLMTLNPAMTGSYAEELASMIGSSIALYGTRSDNILNVISHIQTTENLPHTTINGKWQKESLETGQDFLVYNDGIYDAIDNDIQMAKDSGINYIYGQYGASGPWTADGTFQFNGYFGGSDENAKAMVDKAAKEGVYIGTHTLSNLISYGMPEYMDRLAFSGLSPLTRDLSAVDTTIYVKEGYPFDDEMVAATFGKRELRIGTEFITYTACSRISEDEWMLTGCARGGNGTEAAEHKAGEKVYKIWHYYGCLEGGWESIDPVMERLDTVMNEVGIHAMSYDALEATVQSAYHSLLPTMYIKGVYENNAKAGNADGFITEASDMYSSIWDVHSRISWGESNTPLNRMINYQSYYRLNFFPAMLGWSYEYGNHGGYSEPNLLMNLAMKGGWNAGTGWYVNRNTFKQYPHMPEMLKTWNNAIQKGAFVVNGDYTEEVQAAMRAAWVNGRVWTLTETVPDEEWILQEVNKSNLEETIGNPIKLTATNNINVDRDAIDNGDIATDVSLDYWREHSGNEVTVYTQAYDGYALDADSLKVTGEDGTQYEVTPVEGEYGVFTFTMPDQDVDITAEFAEGSEPVDPATPANKELLQKTYDYALTLDTEGAVESAVKAFENAKAEAKAALEDPEATQEEINTAWDNLLKGIWGLGIVKGEKADLKEVIDRANLMDKDDYLEDNWSKLEEALAEAEKVYADEDATQDVIDAAKEALEKAIAEQELKPVDVVNKDILKMLIDKAENMIPNADKYVETNWPKLVSALEKAKEVYGNEEATQEAVDAAADELSLAIFAQRYKANKSNLQDLVNKAAAIDLSLYTEESVSVFRAALMNARAVLTDDTLSTDDQADVDETVKELEEAIEGLEKKSDGDNIGNKGDDANTGNEDNTSNGNDTGNSNISGNNKTQTPKTGDDSMVMVWLLITFAAVGTAVVTRRKKEA